MSDKPAPKFVGNVKAGKFEDTFDIGFSRDHLQFMMEHLNDKGWVNIRMSKGKISGKPYMAINEYQAKEQEAPKQEFKLETEDSSSLPF